MKSPKWSFKGWSIWEFLKGRKRMVVTVATTALALLIADSGTVAIVSGAVVEAVFAVCEYFYKEYN